MARSSGTIYFERPGVAKVSWDGPRQSVLVEWSGVADSAEFSAILEAEVRALEEHRGARLLADCRRQGVLDASAQDRADREWLPQALAAGLKRFAVVLPTMRLAAINLEDRLGRAGSLEVCYFATVDKARSWLAESFE